MKTKYLIKILIFFTFYVTIYSNVFGKINVSIVVKVGNEIVTNSDLENEIKTILILSNKNINQKNIDGVKDIAIKSLIRNLIKRNEIKKRKIEKYSEIELNTYLTQISSRLKTNRAGLKKIFLNNNLNYNSFLEKIKLSCYGKL